MRKVKQASIVAIVKAYAADCAASGLYGVRPSKADWSAIVTKVTADSGCLRIPWSFSKLNGEMFGEWVKAYDAAKRRLAKGGKLVKAAPKPKARKRTAKPKASAGTDAPKAMTDEQLFELFKAFLAQAKA